MPWGYSEKVLQLFKDAVQGEAGSHMGEIENPDGFGEHGSIVCGDALRFFFRVKKHPTDPSRDIITQARYLTFGCTSAIAASEALCSLLEEGGKTPLEALQITNQDLVGYLGGLPEQKIHCSVMGAEALQAAVIDWAKKRTVDLTKVLPQLAEQQDEGRIVCKCFSVSEPYLRRKIRELKLHSIAEITNALKAGGGCGACQHAPGGLQDLLDEQWGELPLAKGSSIATATETAETEHLSPYLLGRKIERLLDEVIRPLLRQDGGDIELIDIKGTLVYCRLNGACATCHGAQQTLRLMVEQQLKEQVDERLPNTLNLAIHGIEGEAILFELSRNGICASSGSACTSGSLDPSHVLKAMAVPFTAIHGSLRFSLSRYNDEDDIERIIATLPEIVANLRRLSPYWDDKRNCLDVQGL
jgi:NifU-like protein